MVAWNNSGRRQTRASERGPFLPYIYGPPIGTGLVLGGTVRSLYCFRLTWVPLCLSQVLGELLHFSSHFSFILAVSPSSNRFVDEIIVYLLPTTAEKINKRRQVPRDSESGSLWIKDRKLKKHYGAKDCFLSSFASLHFVAFLMYPSIFLYYPTQEISYFSSQKENFADLFHLKIYWQNLI